MELSFRGVVGTCVGGLLPAKRGAQSVRNVRPNVGPGDAERSTKLREEERGVALLGGAGELPALNEGVDGHRGSALHKTQGPSTKAAAITYAHRPRGSMRSIQETESSPHRRFVSRVAPVCPRSRHSRDGRRFGATLCYRAGDGFCRTRPSSCRFRRDLEPIRPTARADSGSWMGSESILHRVPRTQSGQHGARRQGLCPSLEVTSR